MMEKTKKERQERQLKQSFKTIAQLEPHLLTSTESELNNSLLAKIYPQISELNSLRILTILEITYILQVYLELLDKSSPDLISEFKIGIIGGGITGRLILNSLLPFSKDGLNLKNVTISTRQTDNFQSYVSHFGITCIFDNQLTAQQSDFLIIATPATLDNWVISDLKRPLAKRIIASEKKPQSSINVSGMGMKQTSEKSKTSFSKQEDKKKTLQEKEFQEEESLRKFPFKPLVYILTSDFHEEKCKKFFNFPILTPSIRAKDIPAIKQTLQLFTAQQSEAFETHQKIFAWWILRDNPDDKNRLQSGDSENLRQPLSQKNEVIQKYLRTPFNRIIQTLSFACNNKSSVNSISSSISNTVSLSSENIRDTKRVQESLLQVLEVVTSHGEVDSTLFKKLRKWTMAHNNFIS